MGVFRAFGQKNLWRNLGSMLLFPQKLKAVIWARQNGQCGLCGLKFLGQLEKYHYLQKVAKGDYLDLNYGVLLCEPCYSQVNAQSDVDPSVDGSRSEYPFANWDNSDEYQRQLDIINQHFNKCNELSSDLENNWHDIKGMLIQIQNQLKTIRFIYKDYFIYRDTLNMEFDKLREFQTKKAEYFELNAQEIEKNINEQMEKGESLAAQSEDWASARDYLKGIQKLLKGIPWKKESLDPYYSRIRVAFGLIWERQMAKEETLKEENQRNLAPKIAMAQIMAQSSDNYRETRDFIKEVQEEFKGAKLKKEDYDEFLKGIRAAFDLLWERQIARDKDFEEQCALNYKVTDELARQATEAAYFGENFIEANSLIKEAKNQIFQRRPMKKEQVEELKERLKLASETLFSRFPLESEKKAHAYLRLQEFLNNTQLSIEELQEKASRLSLSIARDEESLTYQRDKLANVRPGNREIEIKNSINNKISDISNRIAEKKMSLDVINVKITELSDSNIS